MYDRIRSLREDRDLRQQDLAEYLHCSQVAYSRYELGLRDIPTEVLTALARGLPAWVDGPAGSLSAARHAIASFSSGPDDIAHINTHKKGRPRASFFSFFF